MKKLLTLLISSALTVHSYADSNWTIEVDRIYTNGTTVYGHKFGYFKDKEWCDHDLIFIEWSTYEKGLKEFEGIDAKIAIRLNGEDEVVHVMPSTLMSTAKFPVLMTIGIFKTILFSKELSKDIRESDSIELQFVGSDDLINKLDIKSDVFNTAGLLEAYSKIDNSCK